MAWTRRWQPALVVASLLALGLAEDCKNGEEIVSRNVFVYKCVENPVLKTIVHSFVGCRVVDVSNATVTLSPGKEKFVNSRGAVGGMVKKCVYDGSTASLVVTGCYVYDWTHPVRVHIGTPRLIRSPWDPKQKMEATCTKEADGSIVWRIAEPRTATTKK